MRVAVSFPGCYRRGGVERVVLVAANALAGRGHDVHLFAHDWDQARLDPSVVVHPVQYSERLPLARVRRFPGCCRSAMHSSGLTFDAHGAFGVMSPPGGTIWVGSVHAAWLQISNSQRPWRQRLKQAANPYHRFIIRLEKHVFGGRRYRMLIALTDQVKQDLIEHYHVPPADVAVLPNGYCQSEFNVQRRWAEREQVRREVGLAPGQKAVIFVANETERKGFGPLLKAVAAQGDSSLVLIAVGRIDAARYRQPIAQMGLTDRVIFTGPSDDVGRYYAAADVFAMPTQYEAWGLVIVEAMACGLPVLTSRLAGAAVTITEGATGQLLDDPCDAGEITNKLHQLLSGRHAEPQVIAQSVTSYGWTRVLERYERLLMDPAGSAASNDLIGRRTTMACSPI